MTALLRQLAYLVGYKDTTWVGVERKRTHAPSSSDRKILKVGTLPEATVKGLKTVQMDRRHDHLNSLLKD